MHGYALRLDGAEVALLLHIHLPHKTQPGPRVLCRDGHTLEMLGGGLYLTVTCFFSSSLFKRNTKGGQSPASSGVSLLKITSFFILSPSPAPPSNLPPRKRYTWVIRSRLDIAWILPLPPLSRFSPSRVYAGHNFFPLADQFLLMPRRFAQTVFEAVSLCYDCETLQAQRESMVPAQTESLLRVALRRNNSSGGIVPFGYYEFPVVIVRNNEGGVCEVLHPQKFTCEMLRASGLMSPLTTTGDDGRKPLDHLACMNIMNRWHRQACAEMFPPLEHDSSTSDVVRRDQKRSGSAGGKVKGHAVGDADDGGRGQDKQRQRGDTDGGPGETIVREAATTHRTTAATDAHIVSFEEATRLVKGIRRDLNDLLGTMRLHVAPKQDQRNYFLAHHYPFHQAQTNPLDRERGLLDQIAIIEGYFLSEADFNRLAVAFSCLLSDAAGAGSGPGVGEEGKEWGGNLSSESRRTEGEEGDGVREARAARGSEERDTNLVVLETTAAEEEDLQAVVDCSLVESLHDIWMSLLDTKFEPSETVCRGPAGPCLQRAIEESTRSIF